MKTLLGLLGEALPATGARLSILTVELPALSPAVAGLTVGAVVGVIGFVVVLLLVGRGSRRGTERRVRMPIPDQVVGFNGTPRPVTPPSGAMHVVSPYAQPPYGHPPQIMQPYSHRQRFAPYAAEPYPQGPYAQGPYGQDPYAPEQPYASEPYASEPYAPEPYAYAPEPYAAEPQSCPEEADAHPARPALGFVPSTALSARAFAKMGYAGFDRDCDSPLRDPELFVEVELLDEADEEEEPVSVAKIVMIEESGVGSAPRSDPHPLGIIHASSPAMHASPRPASIADLDLDDGLTEIGETYFDEPPQPRRRSDPPKIRAIAPSAPRFPLATQALPDPTTSHRPTSPLTHRVCGAS